MQRHGRSVRASLARLLGLFLAMGAAASTLCVTYLLVLLAAAASGRRRGERPLQPPPAAGRFLVLIPAHDEETGIELTLAAVRRLEDAPRPEDIIVVADHCTDATEAIAIRAGATVLRRENGARTKGAALHWAIAALGQRLRECDGVLVVDADTVPATNILRAARRRMLSGARIVQADYRVANADVSPATGLRNAGFLLMNTVRPMGKAALGCSAGLRGSGMVFTPDVLANNGWPTTSLLEDFEYHLALLAAGERVEFAAETRVSSPMPSSLHASRSQQARWESGRPGLLQRWGPTLLTRAVRDRDPVKAEAVIDLAVPPQTLLFSGTCALWAGAAATGAHRPRRLAACALLGQAAFVIGGLWVARAPLATYLALLHAPTLVAQKISIFVELAMGRAPKEFRRTAREPPSSTPRSPVPPAP